MFKSLAAALGSNCEISRMLTWQSCTRKKKNKKKKTAFASHKESNVRTILEFLKLTHIPIYGRITRGIWFVDPWVPL